MEWFCKKEIRFTIPTGYQIVYIIDNFVHNIDLSSLTNNLSGYKLILVSKKRYTTTFSCQ